MNVLLTPTLTQFLNNHDFPYCLIKNARSEFSFTTLTPIHAKPTTEQLNTDFDAVLTTANLQSLLDELDDEFILVTLDTTTLLTYVGSLMKSVVKKNVLHN